MVYLTLNGSRRQMENDRFNDKDMGAGYEEQIKKDKEQIL